MLLRDLRPFCSDKQLEGRFDALFDGVEVLPKCFQQQYLDYIKEQKFIEAAQLFVPISHKKANFLRSQGKICAPVEDKKSNQWITTLKYDPELGLQLDAGANMPNDEL